MTDTASLGSITCDLTAEEPELTSELIYDNLTGHRSADARRFNIIHFNDVYNIESRDCEPVGGASRFVAAVEKLIAKGPTIVLFSGDAIMPSSGETSFCTSQETHVYGPLTRSSILPVSILVKGKQMIEILNKCHIACACLGNHDFGKKIEENKKLQNSDFLKQLCSNQDLGMDVLIQRIQDSNFPWVISNVFDQETKKPLGNVPDRHVVELNGVKVSPAFQSDHQLYLFALFRLVKVGIIALIEQEWMATLSTLNFDDVIYESFIESGRKLAIELKENDVSSLRDLMSFGFMIGAAVFTEM